MTKVPVTLNFDSHKVVGEAELETLPSGEINAKYSLFDPDISEMVRRSALHPCVGYSSVHVEDEKVLSMKITSLGLAPFVKDGNE